MRLTVNPEQHQASPGRSPNEAAMIAKMAMGNRLRMCELSMSFCSMGGFKGLAGKLGTMYSNLSRVKFVDLPTLALESYKGHCSLGCGGRCVRFGRIKSIFRDGLMTNWGFWMIAVGTHASIAPKFIAPKIKNKKNNKANTNSNEIPGAWSIYQG
nr:hypothetical protein [Tanacetum cinerariifolium]